MWRSKDVYTNCFFWVVRQKIRRGGHIKRRRAQPLGQLLSAIGIVLAGVVAAAILGWWIIGGLLIGLGTVTWSHWGWTSPRGHVYHFKPNRIGIFPLHMSGYIRLEGWNEK